MKDLTSTSKRNQKVERFLQYSLPSPSLCSTLLDHHTAFNCSTLTFKADIASQNRNVEGVRTCGGEEEMAYQWFMGCAGAGGLCAWLNAWAEKWVKRALSSRATVGTLGKGKSIDCVLALIGGGRNWRVRFVSHHLLFSGERLVWRLPSEPQGIGLS